MPRGSSREELRASQAASSDAFVATDPIYKELHGLLHNEAVSVTKCAKHFVDHTIAFATDVERKQELIHFVEVYGGSIVELAARTPYQDGTIRRRLVGVVHELQKATLKDPQSATGEPLHFHDDQESIIWKDLPEFWLACAEERSGFGEQFRALMVSRPLTLTEPVPWDPTNTTREMERWKNLSAFWAEQSSSSSTDHSKFALDAFHEAFEPVEESAQTGDRDFLLQTACIWMINGAKWMWPHCYRGLGGWNVEKWDHWKRCLEDRQQTSSSDETMALVEEALAIMSKAEDQER
ncbi:hypothetical protein E8E13_000512 [Curvularia kusanoi]|uniref:Uncharacterized protein n=1 Tax=Curvularia kusanoi TaxID=90978 RepID=A0A9P4T439_CURKU|nr:hypothetical protein E8E13_000512 [Curvularia kusanoi]